MIESMDSVASLPRTPLTVLWVEVREPGARNPVTRVFDVRPPALSAERERALRASISALFPDARVVSVGGGVVRMKEHRALIRAWFGGVADGVALERLPNAGDDPAEQTAAPAEDQVAHDDVQAALRLF
jgi:hypothetical protein